MVSSFANCELQPCKLILPDHCKARTNVTSQTICPSARHVVPSLYGGKPDKMYKQTTTKPSCPGCNAEWQVDRTAKTLSEATDLQLSWISEGFLNVTRLIANMLQTRFTQWKYPVGILGINRKNQTLIFGNNISVNIWEHGNKTRMLIIFKSSNPGGEVWSHCKVN